MSAKRRRVFRLPTRHALEDETRSELAFHIEERIEELVAAGRSREDAEREVRARFGDVGRIATELATIDRARRRRAGWREQVESLGTDVRLAIRGMARRPLAAIVIVATLALAIGANTAIYSIVDRLLLHPVPTPALDRLVVIKEDLPAINLFDAQISPGEAVDLIARRDLFERAGGWAGRSANLTGAGEPRRLAVTQTLGDWFGVFAVRPMLGRLYTADDSREGSPRVVVLTYTLWRELGGDPAIADGEHSLMLDGAPATVIGVLPREFRFPRSAELFAPFVLTARALSPQQRASLYMSFVARRAPGVSAERLAAALPGAVLRWADRFPQYAHGGTVLRAVSFTSFLAGDLEPVSLVLEGAVLLVLLIACANVGSLQLVRTTARGQELAVRAALGAGRGAIVRQSLAESLVLACAGGAAGVIVGWLAVRGISGLNAGRYAALNDVTIDGRALAFTAGIAMLAGLLFGVMPAWRATRVDLHDVLREGGRGASLGARRHRLLRAGVVVQVALTLVLLLGSLLTVRSLARLASVDPGFRPEQVTTFRVALPGASYPSPAARIAFFDALVARLEAAPGIAGAGTTAFLPFGGGGNSSPFDVPGVPVDPRAPARHANIETIDGDYLRAMGIPLLAGRSFTNADAGDAVSVIVDAELAEQFFRGTSPLGKTIMQGRPATIVGVVGRVPVSTLGEERHATVYYHYPQYAWLSAMTVVARSALPSGDVLRTARRILAQMDPSLPLGEPATMTAMLEGSLAPQRLAMLAMTAFAALSLMLALLGIYGVMSYSTAQRTQEIGIRLALGAEGGDVVRMVVRGAVSVALAGIAIGLALYLVASRSVAALLYGISVHDPLVLVTSVLVLMAIALLGAWLPARRAARVATNTVLQR